MSAGSKITYWPLRRKHDEIRLLELQPAPNDHDLLQCTIQHAELRKATYDALSYVWGQQDTDKSLVRITYKRKLRQFLSTSDEVPTVQTIEVGSNLAAALRCLRQKHFAITLWIDAICIDQADDMAENEKSWQLGLMQSIYSYAKNVHAWLGPPNPVRPRYVGDIPTAFGLAEALWDRACAMFVSFENASLATMRDQDWLEVCFSLADTTTTEGETNSVQGHVQRWPRFVQALREAVLSDQLLRSRLDVFRAVAQSNYFSRVWILQETGRACALTFHYGRCRAPGRALLLAMSLVSSFKGREGPELDTRFFGCLTARMTCIKQRSFQDVLEVAYFDPPPLRNATVLSDIIFARVGLAVATPDFQINVKDSPAAVFTLTSCYLFSRGFLDPLLSFKPYPWQYSYPDVLSADILPSWAYDWTGKSPDVFNTYRASRDYKQTALFRHQPQAKFGQVMVLRGIQIGRVASVGRRFYDTVLAAGLSPSSVADGSLAEEPTRMPPGKKQAISARITELYREHGTTASDQSVSELFDHSQIFPLAGFLCWWLMWTGPLKRLIASSRAAHGHPEGHPANDVSELLLRRGNLPNARTSLASLIDIHRWNRFFQSPENAEYGIYLADTLFRSAWGTRPGTLDAHGRIGYLPEATRVQDRVVIFYGVKAPLVVREAALPGTYTIVGPAYVCGVMHGDLMDDPGLATYEYMLV